MRSLKTSALALVIVAAVGGCSKTEEPAATARVAPADAVPGAAAPTPVAAPTAAEIADAQRAFAESDAALKAREYKKAVEALIAAQQQRLTEQQSLQSRNRMIQMQSALASAAASGDPNAQAAIQRLREAAIHR